MTDLADAASDAVLIGAVLAGDVNAFAPLVRRHREAVARQVGGRVPRQDVSEVVAEVFCRAYQGLGAYRSEAPFDHWLSAVAARTCHDFWRKRYRERETPLGALSDEARAFVETVAAAGHDACPETLYRRREATELLERALAGLSPADRMVVILTHLEERSTAETARLLGLSRANVKIRAFRARAKLRKALSGLAREGAT